MKPTAFITELVYCHVILWGNGHCHFLPLCIYFPY